MTTEIKCHDDGISDRCTCQVLTAIATAKTTMSMTK